MERRLVAEDDDPWALPTLGSSFAFWRIDKVRLVASTMLFCGRGTVADVPAILTGVLLESNNCD